MRGGCDRPRTLHDTGSGDGRNGKAADGRIIITASHNPRQWNALKLLNARGEFLSDADGREVLRLADAPDFAYPDVDALGCVIERSSFGDEHIDRVLALPLVDAEAVRKRGFRVTVDAVNSVGGIVIPRLLERMGVEVERLNCEPTGDFAHNPEPIAANLSQVMEAVRRNGSDMGIVVDWYVVDTPCIVPLFVSYNVV